MEKEMRGLVENRPRELVTEYPHNWSTDGLNPDAGSLVMSIVLGFTSMAFGTVDAAAWNAYFPSPLETLIWRCSAIYIMVAGLLWSIINLSAVRLKPLDKYRNQLPWMPTRWTRISLFRTRSHQTLFFDMPWIGCHTVKYICLGYELLYAFARVYLVIETFISIRRVPVGTYQTPVWTQQIPHL